MKPTTDATPRWLALALVALLAGCAAAPKIISHAPTAARVGEQYSYGVVAQGSKPIAFEAVEAPPSFSVDKEGKVVWVPTQAGDVEIAILAKNRSGEDKQRFSVHVQETNPPKEYGIGFGLGQGIWKKADATYRVVQVLSDNALFRSNSDFRDGFLAGYLDGAQRSERAQEIDLDRAPEAIDLLFGAAELRDRLSAGMQVGTGLRRNTVTMEDAGAQRRQSMLGGSAAGLAWKSGFVLGYATGGVAAEHAVRVYLALPE